MEKNQHHESDNKSKEQKDQFAGGQPGQQLPANLATTEVSETSTPGQPEQHSESSFPKQEGETLGTP